MIAITLSVAAGAVLVALWLLDQLELLPPRLRITQLVRNGAGAVLLAVLLLAPAAFNEGLHRWVDYKTDQIVTELNEHLRSITEPVD